MSKMSFLDYDLPNYLLEDLYTASFNDYFYYDDAYYFSGKSRFVVLIVFAWFLSNYK